MTEDVKIEVRRLKEEDVPEVAANEALCFTQPWAEHNFLEALTQLGREVIFLGEGVTFLGGRIAGLLKVP